MVPDFIAPAAFPDNSYRAIVDRLRDKIVAVLPVPLDGEEKRVRFDQTGVILKGFDF